MTECARTLLEEWGISIDLFTRPRGYTKRDLVFFLTHVHEDHMQGLHCDWDYGPLHLSQESDVLLRKHYQAGAVLDRFQPWPTHRYRKVKIRQHTVEVACVPANHCTGSVMWLFILPTGRTVLHTGDYRLTPEFFRWRGWSRMKPLCTLLGDTSHDDEDIQMPTLDQSLQALRQVYELRGQLHILTYTSGVECLLAPFCKQFKTRWYVDKPFRTTLKGHTIYLGLPPQYEAKTKEEADLIIQNRQIEKQESCTYVKLSTTWFTCHRNLRKPFEPVRDVYGTYRIFYSTHASREENQQLAETLEATTFVRCVDSILTDGVCHHTALPCDTFLVR